MTGLGFHGVSLSWYGAAPSPPSLLCGVGSEAGSSAFLLRTPRAGQSEFKCYLALVVCKLGFCRTQNSLGSCQRLVCQEESLMSLCNSLFQEGNDLVIVIFKEPSMQDTLGSGKDEMVSSGHGSKPGPWSLKGGCPLSPGPGYPGGRNVQKKGLRTFPVPWECSVLSVSRPWKRKNFPSRNMAN